MFRHLIFNTVVIEMGLFHDVFAYTGYKVQNKIPARSSILILSCTSHRAKNTRAKFKLKS